MDDKAANENDLQVWQSIRFSIGQFDALVMTLLTQGTVLLFVALGVIFGNRENLGDAITLLLGILLFLGTLFLFLGLLSTTTRLTFRSVC